MSAPRNIREALAAEILGELDTLLIRVEALPLIITSAEEKVSISVNALNDAGDKYRMAITAFSEQAKNDLADYLDRKTIEVTTRTVEEQRAAIQEAARMAFRSEASDKATSLGIALGHAAKEFNRSKWIRTGEHIVTAFIASTITCGLMFLLLK